MVRTKRVHAVVKQNVRKRFQCFKHQLTVHCMGQEQFSTSKQATSVHLKNTVSMCRFTRSVPYDMGPLALL